MKAQLTSAIKELEDLGIDLELFYAISSNSLGVSFQGKYNSEIVSKLNEALYYIRVDANGYFVMNRQIGDVLIMVVFN